MPSRPYPYRLAHAPTLDLTSLGTKLVELEDTRQEGFSTSRKLQTALVQAKNNLETDGSDDSPVALDSLLTSIAPSPASREPRQANLSLRVEDNVRFQALQYFLETGTLLPPSECSYATDEEYLGGACMGLCQDLARYGMGRATARDVNSVSMARNLVQELLDFLLKFDFRNGYLRRKYDGTKYALNTLETILYELSVTGTSVAGQDEEPSIKRAKVENLPHEELEAIRSRLEHRDELRETLIKKCRDAQKAAKQAIYALHRKDTAKALQLLKQCEACIQKDLLPIVEEEPPLRTGSFTAVMEEYAEGKLFYVWLLGKDENAPTEKPSGIILRPDDFEIALAPDEYLGGLCDLTGEIGRFAVQQGTERNTEGVKQCLDSNGAIHMAIQTMERFPSGIGKKMDQLRRSVEKLQRILYEMSLSEAAGGRKVESEEIKMEKESD
jgi:predicted translin family RNA/ssDNA-binding protein